MVTETFLSGAEAELAAHGAVIIDRARDALLPDFSRTTLDDRYLQPLESYQDRFYTIASTYSGTSARRDRLYNGMSKLWFMPSTPILSNGGTDRGNKISCFLNEADDTMRSIADLWYENIWLASGGGGIGSYFGNVRGLGEIVGNRGKSSGVIPFLKIVDSLTLGVSQGSLRRGSAAVYLPMWHPEIEEFIELRRPTGGDPNRRCLNLHHGVVISDSFMVAVEQDLDWHLKSPHTGETISVVSARHLWIRLLTARLETGEPYILFEDAIRRHRPEILKILGLEVKTSNLCSEITLPTGRDHLNNMRTAVCCLASLNLETWDEWKDDPHLIEDVMFLLDSVLTEFIETAGDDYAAAKYSAYRERSVGLGVMGFHSFLIKNNIPFGSVMAKVWNKRFFKHIRAQADAASVKFAHELGPCPDAAEAGVMERFSHKLAIAPTASISIICGATSAGIEPIPANVYPHKTLSGSFTCKNKYLEKLLDEHNQNTDDVWTDIAKNHGSVQHLDFLSDDEKEVFKTALEIDPRWVLEHAEDRTPFVCQAQSVNLFLPADVHKRDLHHIHFSAWKKGLKSLYYCRSNSILSASGLHATTAQTRVDYEECLACQ